MQKKKSNGSRKVKGDLSSAKYFQDENAVSAKYAKWAKYATVAHDPNRISLLGGTFWFQKRRHKGAP